MKKIAVLIHSLTIEYSLSVLAGIKNFFRDKDVKLIVAQVKAPHFPHGIYDYQCWTGTSYIFSEQIDGVIIITGSFTSIKREELEAEIRNLTKKEMPIVSVSVKLNLPGASYTHADCTSVYSEVIRHLKKRHLCRKIAFMSANLTNSEEALERFEAYKAGLAENKIKYDPNLVLDGAFTSTSAEEALTARYKNKRDIPFEAIIAANDLMALGCQRYLLKLGVRIPEEVKIIGFDDTSHAAAASPKISTINQQITEHGAKAGELLYRKINGENTPEELLVPLIPLYRQSCGCIPLSNNNNVYRNARRKLIHSQSGDFSQERGRYFDFLQAMENTYIIFDMLNSENTLHALFYTIRYIMQTVKIDALAACFFEAPIELAREDDFVLPHKMKLGYIIDNQSKKYAYEPGVEFDPHEEIFPKGYTDFQKGADYILQPIFSGKKNYGYVIARLTSDQYAIYGVYMKIIINAIASAYEYTSAIHENQALAERNLELKKANDNLDLISRTDDLTQIMNRRGFMELGQKNIDLAIEMNKHGMVFFLDLDNLKAINDTYGHKIGDEAIKTLAEVLSYSFRANDIIARLSGDEFAIIAPGMTEAYIPKLRQKLSKYCMTLSEEHKLPITITCSVGYATFDDKVTKLNELLSNADHMLYNEKIQKHPERDYKRVTLS